MPSALSAWGRRRVRGLVLDVAAHLFERMPLAPHLCVAACCGPACRTGAAGRTTGRVFGPPLASVARVHHVAQVAPPPLLVRHQPGQLVIGVWRRRRSSACVCLHLSAAMSRGLTWFMPSR